MPDTKVIPTAHRPAYEAVIALTDAVCQTRLNEEWASLCRELAAALARKRPSPLLRGQPKIWGAGVLHALGMVNFLFDRSQTPHMTMTELCTAFDVKAATVGNKSKLIRDLFKMHQFDPDWTLPSMLGQNPLVWMLSVNGIIVDARYAPIEFQRQAFEMGLIPYIPGQARPDASGQ